CAWTCSKYPTAATTATTHTKIRRKAKRPEDRFISLLLLNRLRAAGADLVLPQVHCCWAHCLCPVSCICSKCKCVRCHCLKLAYDCILSSGLHSCTKCQLAWGRSKPRSRSS